MKKNNKAQLILETAEQLFLEQGYRGTSMRDLATTCSVGLGLITYYYKTKFDLAKACLQKQFQYIEQMVCSVVPFHEDVLLYHATYLRFSNWYFMQQDRRELYYELLEEGIYSAYIYETVPRTMREINTVYQAGLSEDYVLLYGNYLPMDMEKTLILQKRNGLFSQISFEEISSIVFESAVSHFISDKALIEKTIEQSKLLCRQICR